MIGPVGEFRDWLMEHQKEAGVFATVSQLVDELTDNPAAKMVAEEIARIVEAAGQAVGAKRDRRGEVTLK